MSSAQRGAGQIRPWIKSIVNHTYWVAASSGNNGQMKVDKWKSISNHLINVHEHDSEVFPRCEHGQLIEPRDWMQQGSRYHKMVKDVVESPYLLRDLPKLSPVYQTYGLEVFHSVVNHFAPKSTHFFYMPMLARLCIAAFHYNENGTRRQSITREGELQWSVSYPKAKKGQECVVKPRRVPATFEYVGKLLEKIFVRRRHYPSLKFAYDDFVFGHKADEPRPLTHEYEDFDKNELINRRTSRYNR
ncbi:uncharacterized protein LOC134241368 [Saccostrea cucullata]|uniref:uncharacterized protein LOC134241368 n=1 Tax=Saccostrea cuccullata TaxID=36930 RepID=UPI002ED23E0A